LYNLLLVNLRIETNQFCLQDFYSFVISLQQKSTSTKADGKQVVGVSAAFLVSTLYMYIGMRGSGRSIFYGLQINFSERQ
jgi:hypothetical protein